MISSIEFWNFVIASLAFLVASYSVYYTRKNDKHSIEITNSYYQLVKGRPTLITFDVVNNSNSSIKIKNVELFNSNDEKISHLDYEPEPTYRDYGVGFHRVRIPNPIMPFEYASPFEGEQVLGPYEKLELSYYLEQFSSDMKIKVLCDQRIHRFRKYKLFSPHFKKLD